MAKPKYDCLKCVGYCCGIYDRVPVTQRDLRRLAKHFNLTPEVAERRFTKQYAGERVLRRSADPILGKSCIFQDPVKRICSIYDARPSVCRAWPVHGNGRCVYYDMLEFEREQQGSDDVTPLIQITFINRGVE